MTTPASTTAGKKSGNTADLLVRVRFQNPLPCPTFPPKYVDPEITTSRLASYEYLQALLSERELPLHIDHELGLHAEVGQPSMRQSHVDYWTHGRDPELSEEQLEEQIDDEDLALLMDPAAIDAAEGSSAFLAGKRVLDDGFGRATKKEAAKLTELAAPAPAAALSRADRIKAIEHTFDAAHGPLESLTHPEKPGVTAVEAFELLPNDHLWLNDYSLVKFSELPLSSASDERLPRTLLRYAEFEGEKHPRVSIYATEDPEKYSKKRRAKEYDGEEFPFEYIKDFEKTNEKELTHEYLFTFNKNKAYYSGLSRSENVRKRRLAHDEDPTEYPTGELEFYDTYNITIADEKDVLPQEELEAREILSEQIRRG